MTKALILRFYCALVVSATIHVILTKILNRSGIAVQWNGGLTDCAMGPGNSYMFIVYMLINTSRYKCTLCILGHVS